MYRADQLFTVFNTPHKAHFWISMNYIAAWTLHTKSHNPCLSSRLNILPFSFRKSEVLTIRKVKGGGGWKCTKKKSYTKKSCKKIYAAQIRQKRKSCNDSPTTLNQVQRCCKNTSFNPFFSLTLIKFSARNPINISAFLRFQGLSQREIFLPIIALI